MISAFTPSVTITPTTHHITSSGNLISVHARIQGPTAIVLHGRNVVERGVVLRGDLRRRGEEGGREEGRALVLGRYCWVGEGSVVRPPGRVVKGTFTYYKLTVGDCVSIGAGCVVEALTIGKGVQIGSESIIGKFSIIGAYAVIDPNSVLPPGTVVPCLTRWSGNPAKYVADVPETAPELTDARMRAAYKSFNVHKDTMTGAREGK